MDLNLKDKVALVCGASGGLGYAIAREFARERATTIICSSNEQRIHNAAENIQKEIDIPVYPFKTDLRDHAEIDSLINSVNSHFAKIDILINNTGGPPAGFFLELTDDDWRNAYQLTFSSAIYLTKKVLPAMINQKWGRIINLTSLTVKQPIDNLILSNSLRLAIIGWAKTIANQLGKFGVTVNNIATGRVLTERLRDLAEYTAHQRRCTIDKIFESWIEHIPVHRLGEPEDIAAMTLFLASDKAGYITGTTISVDGGEVQSIM